MGRVGKERRGGERNGGEGKVTKERGREGTPLVFVYVPLISNPG